MRLRLLIVGGLFVAVVAVASGFGIASNENSSTDSTSDITNTSGGLKVQPSQGEPKSTSHLLQGSQSSGGLQQPSKGLQDSADGKKLQSASERDSF